MLIPSLLRPSSSHSPLKRLLSIRLYHATTAIMSNPEETSAITIGDFVACMAAKQPTPGGGAAAAVGAAIGASAASMAAAYTQRKKDEETGKAELARALIAKLELQPLIQGADEDAKAYGDLQKTWKKDHGLSDEQISAIQARALEVPTELVVTCHSHILSIRDFLPDCNPNITSDAKVGIHHLAGAARAAYQTSLVNSPPPAEKQRLQKLLLEIQQIEADLLQLDQLE
jgi:formiminotetrahydrofolate cyclodeaminase